MMKCNLPYNKKLLFIYILILLLFHNCLSIQISCGKSFFPCKSNLKSKYSLFSSPSTDYTRGFAPLYSANRLHGLKNTYTVASSQQLKENNDLTFKKLKQSFPISNQTLLDAIIETEREVQVIYNEKNAKPIDISIILFININIIINIYSNFCICECIIQKKNFNIFKKSFVQKSFEKSKFGYIF